MKKEYRGRKENGQWENFDWSMNFGEPTTEKTGYEEVEPV